MENFKEFQGKTLDAAINEACQYFDVPREKLEIDIIQDAKSGIFGIVGVRKAKIRARRTQLREAFEGILGESRRAKHVLSESSSRAPRQRREKSEHAKETAAPAREAVRQPVQEAPASRREEVSAQPGASEESRAEAPAERERTESSRREGWGPRSAKGRYPRRQEQPRRFEQHADDEEMTEDSSESFHMVPLEQLDSEKLRSVVLEVVGRLVAPLSDDVQLGVEISDSRINVMIDCGETSGLLIGREGQTLIAVQYLASRLVSRKMEAAVRVHLDAGSYRLRQDEKLKDIALSLAERVRMTGRSCSTRPLSSYHRRIVHLALQDVEDIQTRSSGDGPMKRVVIMRKKSFN